MADDTRQRLIAEARDQYLAHGLESLSLREVARRVGISPAGVYRHFNGRDALLDEVCAEGFRVFGSYLVRALDAKDPRGRLAKSAEMYLRFAIDNPRDYRVIFMSEKRGDRDRPPTPGPTFQFLVDRVRECIDAGVLRKGDPVEIAVIVWSHVHGLVSLRLCGQLERVGDARAFDKFYRRAVDDLVVGLGGQ